MKIEQKRLAVLTAIKKVVSQSINDSKSVVPDGTDIDVEIEIRSSFKGVRFNDVVMAHVTKGFGYNQDVSEVISSEMLLTILLTSNPELINSPAVEAAVKAFKRKGNEGLEKLVKDPSDDIVDLLSLSRDFGTRPVSGAIRFISASSKQLGDAKLIDDKFEKKSKSKKGDTSQSEKESPSRSRKPKTSK